MTETLRLRPVPRSLAILAAAVLLLTFALARPALAADGVIEVSEGDGLVPSVRYAGENRFDTAELVATDSTPFRATYSGAAVIVATGENFPDALAASVLGGAAAAPIVLTTRELPPSGELVDDTAAALDYYAEDPDDIFPEELATIYIVGGVEAVSQGVEDAIADAHPDIEIVRLGGADRFATAVEIADEATAGAPSDTVIVARAGDYADALVAGSIAAAAGIPILLASSTGPLYHATEAALADYENAIIAGGTAAISTDVEDQIADALAEGGTVERVAGGNRYGTAVAFAETATATYGFGESHANLATGGNFPDALALGPHAGLDFDGPAPILLTNPASLPPETDAYLTGLASGGFTALHVAGGPVAVSATVLEEARTLLTAEGEPSAITLEVEADEVPVGEDATVTATVVDNGGTPVDGEFDIVFTAEADEGTVVTPDTETVAAEDGAAPFTFSSDTAGAVTVTATAEVDDVPLEASTVVTFVAELVPVETAMFAVYEEGGPGSDGDTVLVTISEGEDDALVTEDVPIDGIVSTEVLVGLDYRSSTGDLYGITETGQLYVIELAVDGDGTTATAAAVGDPLDPDTEIDVFAGAAFDIDPVTDLIRIINIDGVNVQVDPDTGDITVPDEGVAYGAEDDNTDPVVFHAAHGDEELYVIDTFNDVLALHDTGELTTVADLVTDIDVSGIGGFDAFGDDGAAYALLAPEDDEDPLTDELSALYSVNLVTGELTSLGELGELATAFTIARAFDATFDVELDAANEEPPADSVATGRARLSLDVAAGEVCYAITVEDVEGDDGTFEAFAGVASHIHEGGPDETGDVVIPLETPDDDTGTATGCTTTDFDLQLLIDDPNGYYVNVHTDVHAAGLVRGQLDNVNELP